MALLASYMLHKEEGESLCYFLGNRVFHGDTGESMSPDAEDVKGFETFIERYKAGIEIEEGSWSTSQLGIENSYFKNAYRAGLRRKQRSRKKKREGDKHAGRIKERSL